MERWNKSFKIEGWRPGLAGDVAQARAMTGKYVKHYNEVRLHSAIGYITPKDKLEGREQEIWKQRDEQLENARKWRANQRRSAAAKQMVESLVAKWSVSLRAWNKKRVALSKSLHFHIHIHSSGRCHAP